jgi:hypothetical protein
VGFRSTFHLGEGCVSTVIELTDQELAELKAFTKQSDTTAAIRSAMSEYLRLARRMELKASSGKIVMDDNWQALEDAELRTPHGDSATGAH